MRAQTRLGRKGMARALLSRTGQRTSARTSEPPGSASSTASALRRLPSCTGRPRPADKVPEHHAEIPVIIETVGNRAPGSAVSKSRVEPRLEMDHCRRVEPHAPDGFTRPDRPGYPMRQHGEMDRAILKHPRFQIALDHDGMVDKLVVGHLRRLFGDGICRGCLDGRLP